MAETDFNYLSFLLYVCITFDALEDFVAEVNKLKGSLTDDQLEQLRTEYAEQRNRIKTGKQFY